MGFLLSDPYNDGGQWDMIVNLVNKYGLVPKIYYPETHSSEGTRNLNKILANKVTGRDERGGNPLIDCRENNVNVC